MTKIMLVEDDKSLREIYGVRLLAEGYDIVSAGDGEEALAMAIKERPQLIISDVMMPKVSGYDMLDILRSTTETKNIRVIMMTALSSEEQRARAESLGADRYLVKSQVGIEDVVRVVHEVLEDAPEAVQAAPAPISAPAPIATRPAPLATPAPVVPPRPVEAPVPVIMPVAAPVPVTQSPLLEPSDPVNTAPSTTMPVAQRPDDTPKPASLKTRIIQPLSDPSISPVNINDLLDKELAKEAGLGDTERPSIESINQERAEIAAQLQSFTPPELTPVAPSMSTMPTPIMPGSSSLLPTPGVGEQPMTPTPTPVPLAPPTPAPQAMAVPVAPSTPTPPVLTPTMPSATPPAQPTQPPVTDSSEPTLQLPEVPTM